jgi:RNA polymerase primary sigma factor
LFHSPSPESPDSALEAARLSPLLMGMVRRLKPQQQTVIALRYGGDMTLEEIASVLRLTRERIRQVESKALRTLRHPSMSNQIKDYEP